MKLLKKQQGLPFLLAMGVLFILSASFLAVQLWDDRVELRGAAAALEAPVLPPSLNAPTVVAPPPAQEIKLKNTEKKETVQQATDEVKEKVKPSELKKEKTELVKVAEVADNTKAQVVNLEVPESVADVSFEKSEVKSQAKKAVGTEKTPAEKNASSQRAPGTAGTDRAETKDIEKKDLKNAVERASVAEKAVKAVHRVKPAKKMESAKVEPVSESVHKRVARRKAAKREVPTEVPPEWNWFSKPLKLDMTEGRVEIVPCADKRPVEIKTPGMNSKTARQTMVEAKSIVRSAPKMPHMPFSRALAKMAQIKAKRASMSKKAGQKPVVEEVLKRSKSMKRLNEELRKMGVASGNDNSERIDFNVKVNSASVSQEAHDTGSVSEDTEVSESGNITDSTGSSKDEISYSGSGSSFSIRVREMIRSGAWLRN
ncbi:MAG: hypothetical protein Kow0029_03150 [Candidatus Rifleibacteriota bacterium]